MAVFKESVKPPGCHMWRDSYKFWEIQMKIGILTFHKADNYGALLQVYALQQILLKRGFDVKVIDYVGEYLKHPFGLANWKTRGVMAQFLTLAGELSRLPRRKKFEEFRQKLICTAPISQKELPSLESQFDLFIAGSDQVWNYQITNKDSAYLLDFVTNGAKKGSYAASFGFAKASRDVVDWYRPFLQNYKYLNIRERSALPMVKDMAGRGASVVMDPTFLISKEEWLKTAVLPQTKEPYILTYQVGMSKELLRYAKFLAAKTGYKLYSIPLPQGGLARSRNIVTAGPCEWLGWIAQAQYVVTDSFHGVALSVLFEKEFFVRIAATVAERSSRIDDLLSMLEIRDRYIRPENGDSVPEPIDYASVAARLRKCIDQSFAKLMEMCGGSL